MENVSSLVTPRTSDLRSRRMGRFIQHPSFPATPRQTDSPITPPISPKEMSSPTSSPSSTSSLTLIPPPPPPRSPLRPSAKSVASFTTFIDSYKNRDTISTINANNLDSVPTHNRSRGSSFSSISALIEQLDLDASNIPSKSAMGTNTPDSSSPLEEKPLPSPPEEELFCDSPTTISLASETSTLATITPIITKREHALKELLSSERAYASDLAFIRNVHIPMALGKQPPYHLPRPATPPRSSSSSARTISTSSESSSGSSGCTPPMSKDDVRVIFGNITELAMFSDMFSERLEEALGDVLDDGKGEDWVGALFLEIIPQMEPPYMTYITKQPNALNHLNSLHKTPALCNYLAQTQHLATSVTHAWDLPSLLIKPVQRLLKYSLLLRTIIEQTPDCHGDKENLKEALKKMEELAKAVNESRRRMEIVKGVLTNRSDSGKPTTLQKKLTLGKATHVGVSRMKSMSINLRTPRPKEENNVEAARVAELEKRLRECEGFVREFAKNVMGWVLSTRTAQEHLQEWAAGFGRTIGIQQGQPSEAFDAFMDVIDAKLLPICLEMYNILQKHLLPQLARLLDSTKAPLRLLDTMHSLEHMHCSLLNFDLSKSRPPQVLVDASQRYLALRGQLAVELPKYLSLFDNGISVCLHAFLDWQTGFWYSIRDEWGTLWDCLRMEGETNAGCEETLTLWWNRYSEVEEKLSRLNIIKRERPFYQRPRTSGTQSLSSITGLEGSLVPTSSLPMPSGNSIRHRNFGSQDISLPKAIRRSPSEEALHPFSNSQRGKCNSRTIEGSVRKKGRSNTSPLPTSSSQFSLNASINSCPPLQSGSKEYAESIDSRSERTGRKSRSSSLSRIISETLRTPLRRSPSQKSINSQRSNNVNGSGPHGHFILNMDDTLPPPLPDQLDIYPPPNSSPGYYVKVLHPCCPPSGASYMELPFLELRVDEIFGVLSELGHPSTFRGLCISVDDGEEDCLLVLKGYDSVIGLALASFFIPIS